MTRRILYGRPLAGRSRPEFAALLAQSSLGDAEVMDLSERAPSHVVDAIVDRAVSEAPGYHHAAPSWAGTWRTRSARKLARRLLILSMVEDFQS